MEVNAAASPASRLPTGLWRHRELLRQLAVRDVAARYRGSFLGAFWSLLNPLFMLAVFAVVFGVIFEGKFTGHPQESRADFALQLFAGMVVFNFFADLLMRAPMLVVASPSYVTRVVFPLEILPAAAVGAGLVHLVVSLVPLVGGLLWLRGGLPWTALQWPLLLLPLLAWTLAVGWLLGALGVFLRDLQQVVSTVSLVLMYASAIFYPIEKVQEDLAGIPLRAIVRANPLAFLAESSRNLLVWGAPLDLGAWCLHSLVGLAAMFLARTIFRRLQPTFADVL